MAMPDRRHRPLPPAQEVDVRQSIQEAQTRWLRPLEVCEILRNYQKHNFKLNPVPPNQPASGSMFLFDRKALRYFRKDGHNWRKKKDGKTVREAHERLKAGSVDVLHCYYAHGEGNVNFQRRCYWMLDGSYEHIVLVHYREVTEVNRSCIVRTINDHAHSAVPTPPYTSPVSMSVPPAVVASPEVSVEVSEPLLSPELEEGDSGEGGDEFEESAVQEPVSVQPSLLEQIEFGEGHPHISRLQGKTNADAWSTSVMNSADLGGMGGRMSANVFTHESKYKQPFPDLQQVQAQVPQEMNKYLPFNHFSGTGDLGIIKNEFMDLLDSPGSSMGPSRPAASLDLSSYGLLLQNRNLGAKAFAKPEVPSPTWAEMFEQCTTPVTRKVLLEGLPVRSNTLPQSPLGQSSHGKDLLVSGAPPLKGIMEVLSPTLHREPTTDLEARLHAVTEGNVLKSVAEFQARQRSWQIPQTEAQHMEVTSATGQKQMGAHQVISNQSWNSGTLEEVVQSGQPQQDSLQAFPTDRNSWSHSEQQQTPPQSTYEQEYQNHSNNMHLFDQTQPAHVQQSNDQKPFFPHNFTSFFDSGLLSPVVKDAELEEDRPDGLKKLDSFGRWMIGEYGADNSTSLPLLSRSSGSFWATGNLEDQGTVGELSSLSQHMQLDVGPSPSLSEQCFSISDFSPEWAFSYTETKVLVTGSFIDRLKNPSEHKWCCMFGEIEVHAEVLEEGVLRCRAPPNIGPGRVPFYVTRNDRQACSQVREFEYRSQAGHLSDMVSSSVDSHLGLLTEDEILLQIRLIRLLFETPKSALSMNNSRSEERIASSQEEELRLLENDVHSHKQPLAEVKEQLLQILLKQRLKDWLSISLQLETDEVPSNRDERGQGVPHVAAALGYEWSVDPLLDRGVPINWRDKDGWTALHWAAHCGREQVVLDLLAAGAAPGAVTDPTNKSPTGLTPADLASASGHGGIAAYLAEASLTCRLSCMSLNEGTLNEMDARSAALAGEKAVARLSRRTSIQRSVREASDHAGLQQSLEAVRNAYQAAALIQSVFRQHSFRRRQEKLHFEDEEVDEYGLSREQVQSMVAAQRIQKAYRGHQQQRQRQHLAATQIQRKFRGWKGRKDFLTFRQRIVKLQAHFRGRLVRKHIRKLLWSVSILEKAVLRWRRKRPGLRGFRAEQVQSNSDLQNAVSSDDDEEFLKLTRQQSAEAVEKAVTRVQSMVPSSEARAQYQRLREGSRLSSAEYLSTDLVPSSRDYMVNHEDHLMSAAD